MSGTKAFILFVVLAVAAGSGIGYMSVLTDTFDGDFALWDPV